MILLGYFSIFMILVPLLIGGLRIKQLEPALRLLWVMLIPITLNQFAAAWWGSIMGKNNFPFFHLYVILESIMLVFVFRAYLRSENAQKAAIAALAILFLIEAVSIISGGTQVLWSYPDHIRAVESLIVLGLSGYAFTEIFRRQEILYLHKSAQFWVGAGLIIYFASNLMLFTFNKLVLRQSELIALYIWSVHAALNILLYITYSIAFLCNKTKTIHDI